jgi:hypothetical protein
MWKQNRSNKKPKTFQGSSKGTYHSNKNDTPGRKWIATAEGRDEFGVVRKNSEGKIPRSPTPIARSKNAHTMECQELHMDCHSLEKTDESINKTTLTLEMKFPYHEING